METLFQVLSDPVAAGIAFGFSIALFGLGLIGVPIVIARMPADYFVRPRRHAEDTAHPVLWLLRRTLQNLLGGFLLIAGVAMLFLPGQGVLTILAGLSLLEFPGKRRVQRRLLGLPGVERVVSAIRHRAGAPPLVLEREHERDRGDSSA